MPSTLSPAIGAREHFVVIQSCVDGTDASGFPIESFVDLARVWASREAQWATRAAEVLREDQITARAYDRWTFPYLAAVDPDLVTVPKLRLLCEGRAYDVLEAHVLRPGMDIQVTTLVKAA